MTCCHRCDTAAHFDTAVAQRDLRRFRRRGPDAPTLQLLRAVQSRVALPHPTLLDIGGGIGAIHHVLLEHGFSQATHLDASQAYLAAATEEASRIGHTHRVQFHLAAFPDEAATVPSADVVTLDRVVCCDPDYRRLLTAAANRARHLVAFSYPRPRWVTRLVVSGTNWFRRLAGRTFQAYLHSPAAMHALVEEAGMRRTWSGGTWIWAVDVFERAASVEAR